MSLLDGPLDGVLHLLDRQVVDVDGRMVVKVDDLEISEYADGSLAVTGLLTGPPALVPRLGGEALLRRWRRLGVERADRLVPGWIPLTAVTELTSEARLDVGRDGLVVPQPTAADVESRGALRPAARLRRLDHLLGAEVLSTTGDAPGRGEGNRLGRVTDVRIEPPPGGHRRGLRVVALIVGRGRPGTMLGYDRSTDQGPLLLNRTIRFLHRHTGLVDLADVERIDWDARRVLAAGGRQPLTHARR